MTRSEAQVRKWWILVAMTSCISMIFIDQTVLPVALPTMQRELNLSALFVQWAVNAYLLALTALVLGGGKLGDILGHKWSFCMGIVVFGTASILCGLSYSGWWLVSARVLQGVGASLLLPATGSIILDSFPPHQRGRAMGIYVSVGSLFLAMGPFIGGMLTEYLSWRYIFWINIPIALWGLILALIFVPKKAEKRKKQKFDFLGFFTFAAGMGLVVVAIMQGGDWGWQNAKTITPLVVGIALLLLLIRARYRHDHPIIDFSLFKIRAFSGATLCTFFAQFLLMTMVFWAIYFQVIMGYSAAEAGVIALIANIPLIFFAPISGYLVDKFGPKVPVATGFVVLAFGIAYFIIFRYAKTFPILLPGLLPIGIGASLVFTPSYVGGMADVAAHKRGSATGANMALRQFGATLGMALIGMSFLLTQKHLFAQSLKGDYLTEQIDPNQFDGLVVEAPKAIKTLETLPPAEREIVFDKARIAYISGFAIGNSVALLGSVLGFIFALIFFHRKKKWRLFINKK